MTKAFTAKSLCGQMFAAALLIGVVLLSNDALAQPSNNNCGGAIVLPVNSTCLPTNGSSANATQSQSGCNGNADDDVWYSFVSTGSALAITVSGTPGYDPVIQVFSGTCGGSSLACVNSTGTGGTETANLTNLFNNVTYWVRVYHAGTGSGSGNFTICVHDPILEPACNPNSPEPINTMDNCSEIPKICQVNGFCGTTSGYHATPSSTSLTPYTPNFWAQLNAAFCGSIENNAFCRFTASSASVQLRLYGGCTSGTGIQLMVFSLTNANPGTCNNGNVQTYGCQYLNLTTATSSGVPISFTGMTPGTTYYLMIDGFAGAICDYKIGADFGVQLSTTVTPKNKTVCLGGSVNLSASGGNGTYTWDLNPTLSATTGANVVATPLVLGMNTYVASSVSTDPDCPATGDTAFITVTTLPFPDAGVDDSVCLGDPIQLGATVSDLLNTTLWQILPPAGVPTSSVQFAPNFSVPNPTVNFTQAGLYKFVFRETSQLCGQYRDTVGVSVIGPEENASATAPSCFGKDDGQITINNAFADEYSYDGGVTWVPQNTQGGFTAGTYNVCTRNYLGCNHCFQVTITDGPQIALAVSADTLICENGTATVSGQGTGGNSFIYHWDHTSDQSAAQQVSPTHAGYYYVHVENQGGCLSGTDSIFVDISDPIFVTTSADTAVCPDEMVVMTAAGSGGNGGPYNFVWSHGPTANGQTTNSQIINPNLSLVYTVSVTDNCESSVNDQPIEVNVHPLPEPSFFAENDSVCEPARFIIHNGTDPSLSANTFWELSDGQVFQDVDVFETDYMKHGSYGLTLTVSSPEGCIATVSVPNFVKAMVKPKASFKFSPSPVSMFNTEVTFGNYSSGAQEYEWIMPGASPSYSTEAAPTVRYEEGRVDNYRVEMIARSNFGCVDTALHFVEVLSEVILYVPNAFTPNGDKFNNTWTMSMAGLIPSTFDAKVYNRWGQMIFHSTDVNTEWDGTYNGEIVPSGIYTYVIKADDQIRTEHYEWTGNLTIIR